MKYKSEFEQFGKKDFIRILVREHNVKPQSAERTWYKYNKVLNPKRVVNIVKVKAKEVKPKKIFHSYLPEEKEEVPKFKMLEFDDMLRFKLKLTRSMLRKYGFKNLQINWLKDQGYEIIEDNLY